MGLDIGIRVTVHQVNEYSHVIDPIDCGSTDFGVGVLPPGLVEGIEHCHLMVTWT
jgi:hypothetical protein